MAIIREGLQPPSSPSLQPGPSQTPTASPERPLSARVTSARVSRPLAAIPEVPAPVHTDPTHLERGPDRPGPASAPEASAPGLSHGRGTLSSAHSPADSDEYRAVEAWSPAVRRRASAPHLAATPSAAHHPDAAVARPRSVEVLAGLPPGCRRTVTIVRPPGVSLGLMLASSEAAGHIGARVSNLVAGSHAALTGAIRRGDWLVAVNDAPLLDLHHSDIIRTIAALGSVAQLLFVLVADPAPVDNEYLRPSYLCATPAPPDVEDVDEDEVFAPERPAPLSARPAHGGEQPGGGQPGPREQAPESEEPDYSSTARGLEAQRLSGAVPIPPQPRMAAHTSASRPVVSDVPPSHVQAPPRASAIVRSEGTSSPPADQLGMLPDDRAPHSHAAMRECVLQRTGGSLGLRITAVPGLVGSRVSELVAGGAASVAGITPGDIVVAVNGVGVLATDHARIVALLRESGDRPRLRVARPHVYTIDVVLARTAGLPWGIDIVEDLGTVYLTAVTPGSIADSAGLRVNDVVLRLLGVSVDALGFPAVLQCFHDHARIDVAVQREADLQADLLQTMASAAPAPVVPTSTDAAGSTEPPAPAAQRGARRQADERGSHAALRSASPAQDSIAGDGGSGHAHTPQGPTERTVTLGRDAATRSFGFTVCSIDGCAGASVSSVQAGSPAARAGLQPVSGVCGMMGERGGERRRARKRSRESEYARGRCDGRSPARESDTENPSGSVEV